MISSFEAFEDFEMLTARLKAFRRVGETQIWAAGEKRGKVGLGI